jgi:tRNA(fMet)-specific endonuclease VapC
MGLVLDSSVLIVAEREAKPVSTLLAAIQQEHGENEIVLSSITVVELEHGLHRAQTAEQAQKRRNYLDEVFAAIPVESFSREMAQIAAKVDADARRLGKVIPFADLPSVRRPCTMATQSVPGTFATSNLSLSLLASFAIFGCQLQSVE